MRLSSSSVIIGGKNTNCKRRRPNTLPPYKTSSHSRICGCTANVYFCSFFIVRGEGGRGLIIILLPGGDSCFGHLQTALFCRNPSLFKRFLKLGNIHLAPLGLVCFSRKLFLQLLRIGVILKRAMQQKRVRRQLCRENPPQPWDIPV